MYYDNQNPFAKDSYRNLMVKEARGTFSRVHLGLLIYIVSAYAISIVADVLLLIFLGDSYESIMGNIYFQWFMGVVPMYAVGLPLLWLTVRNMPTKRLEKSKLSAGEFLIIFAIAQTLMSVGNSIGNTLNGFFGALRGDEITNTTSQLIENSPIWLTLVVAVIIGPVIEEFIFRKLMVDRLARYGSLVTVLVSGISFGLFHGNLYQFFYAALLGMLLAFVTLKTGNWLYSVALHIIINFFGSIVVMPFIDMAEELTAGMEALEAGSTVDGKSLIMAAIGVLSYSIVQYALVIAGAVLIILAVKNKWYKLKESAEVNIPSDDVAISVVFNLGTLLFLAVSLILFAVSVLLG